MSQLETELFHFEKRMDEAEALDKAEAYRQQISAEALRDALAGKCELGDRMFPTLLDLLRDFAGFGKEGAVDHFLVAAARSLYAKAEAGDVEAQADIEAIETYLLER
jgi:hypothetical protein